MKNMNNNDKVVANNETKVIRHLKKVNDDRAKEGKSPLKRIIHIYEM
jgi:phosphopantetheine adenylyltransferase